MWDQGPRTTRLIEGEKMTDEEMIITVAVLAGAYYVFIVKGKRRGRTLQGRRTTGASGTIGGGASKSPTRFHNNNPFTNAQQNGMFSPAPVASISAVNTPTSSNVGASSSRSGIRSRTSSGVAGSFVSPQWPTRRVTSTGSQAIGTGSVSVPSYAAIPLTQRGPGGGGSWLH
jgi:hypothetical protein